MNKNKNNQNGFVHIPILIAIVLTTTAVGYAGFRVVKSNNAAQPGSNPTSAQEEIKDDIKDADTKESQEETPEQKPSDTATGSAGVITFTKGGGGLEGETVKVSATTANPQTGTCRYTFALGNSKIEKKNTIKDSRTCAISVPLSAFPKNGDWSFVLYFTSNDGKVTGKGGGYTIPINPQPRKISFIKGGGGQSGKTVSVSGTLSEDHSGTCTYSFSLNGTVRVKKSAENSSLRYCSLSIPTSEFPKSGTYSFSLTFVSKNGLVTASQSPYNITIN